MIETLDRQVGRQCARKVAEHGRKFALVDHEHPYGAATQGPRVFRTEGQRSFNDTSMKRPVVILVSDWHADSIRSEWVPTCWP